MTDEQYIDELFAREVVGMDTPGFRDFVLDLMGIIGERPRAGDVCSMHLAYRAGMEQSQAPNWTTERPTKDGTYWMSLRPEHRYIRETACTLFGVMEPVTLYTNADGDQIILLDRWDDSITEDRGGGLLDGALWAPRETPADPFKEVGK